MQPIGSLGGKNIERRFEGARSSRARSTILEKLRRLDRKIYSLEYRFNLLSSLGAFGKAAATLKRLKIADEKRKQLRIERKKHAK